MTEETISARSNFIASIFPIWKKEISQRVKRHDCENKIVWRQCEDGFVYGPDRIALRYFSRYRNEMAGLMKQPEQRLDRHKIIALSQKLFIEELPITLSDIPRFDFTNPPVAVCTLNTSFAYYFGLQFLCRWHEKTTPQVFNSELFLDSLTISESGKRFGREHHKYLMSELRGPFPAVLIAHLWFALEQWGLTYMELQSVKRGEADR